MSLESRALLSVQTYTVQIPPYPIADNPNASLFFSLDLTGAAGTVSDINVTINISHTWDSDLTVSLVAPNGATVELTSGNGGSGDNFHDTTFNDEAVTPITSGAAPFTGSFRPEGLLSTLDGISVSGEWRLKIVDTVTGDAGTIDRWSMEITSDADQVYLADFSGAGGNPSLDGFSIDNTGSPAAGLWHLSTGRGANTGHSTDDSMYFGQGEGPAGGGNYNVGDTQGRITSPAINLSGAESAALLFNYFLQVETTAGKDLPTVSVSNDRGQSFVPVRVKSALWNNSLWQTAVVDLDAFVGETILIEFNFDTVDGADNATEGWYIDDVRVDAVVDPSFDLVFTARGNNGQRELFKTNGTALGTSPLTDLNGANSSDPGRVVFNPSGIGFFPATNGGQRELYGMTGYPSETALIQDLNGAASSSPRDLTWGNGFLYFTANVGGERELWRTTGAPGGAQLVRNLRGAQSADVSNLVFNAGKLYFVATNAGQRELWVSDGTEAGTTVVKNLNGASSSHPSSLVAAGSRVYFTAIVNGQRELYRTNGTADGTTLVKNLRGNLSPNIEFITPGAGTTVYFTATNSGQTELWKTNGTEAGTLLVRNLNGASSSNPANLAFDGSVLYFAATNAGQRELWKTDGSEGGTVQVKNLNGSASSTPQSLTVGDDGLLYFSALVGTQRELWKSDGTSAGTGQVANLNGGVSSEPKFLTSINGKLYFVALTGSQEELFVYDQAAQTSRIVRNLNGSTGAKPRLLSSTSDSPLTPPPQTEQPRTEPPLPVPLTARIAAATMGNRTDTWQDWLKQAFGRVTR